MEHTTESKKLGLKVTRLVRIKTSVKTAAPTRTARPTVACSHSAPPLSA